MTYNHPTNQEVDSWWPNKSTLPSSERVHTTHLTPHKIRLRYWRAYFLGLAPKPTMILEFFHAFQGACLKTSLQSYSIFYISNFEHMRYGYLFFLIFIYSFHFICIFTLYFKCIPYVQLAILCHISYAIHTSFNLCSSSATYISYSIFIMHYIYAFHTQVLILIFYYICKHNIILIFHLSSRCVHTSNSLSATYVH